MSRRTIRVVEPSSMILLPPAPDACQVCARRHEPAEPHDAGSLYWATKRVMEGGPRPTWEEALAHVADDVYEGWRLGLAEHDVIVPPRTAEGSR